MKLSWKSFEITPVVPFAIARGTTTSYSRILVRVEHDEVPGCGEAAPNAFYHEDAISVHKALAEVAVQRALPDAIQSVDDIARVEARLREIVPAAASARAAISAALHDQLGRVQGKPVHALFGLQPNLAPLSSYTIGIPEDEPALRRSIDDADEYPILKIKLGTDRDEWTVRAVRRAAPRKTLRVDANAAWDVEKAIHMLAFLADEEVELVEQPLPKDDMDGFWRLREHARIPVIADESCVDARDLPRLDGAVDGINIKLAKCGGIAEARRMAIEARQRGMKVMLGCMIESSLGITAAAHLASLADYADLDGAALLADDPFTGATIHEGVIRLPDEPGLGVRARRA